MNERQAFVSQTSTKPVYCMFGNVRNYSKEFPELPMHFKNKTKQNKNLIKRLSKLVTSLT